MLMLRNMDTRVMSHDPSSENADGRRTNVSVSHYESEDGTPLQHKRKYSQ